MFASRVPRAALEERLDPAFYSPHALEAQSWAARYGGQTTTLAKVVRIATSAFYEGIAGRYRRDGVPLIRVGDVRQGTINVTRTVRLPEAVATGTPGLTCVTSPFVAVTKGGSVGRVGVETTTPVVAISRDVLGLVPVEEADREDVAAVLVFFLASPPGRQQVLRGASRQVQAHLTTARLGAVVVPVPDESGQTQLTNLMRGLAEARRSFDTARADLDAYFAALDPFAALDAGATSYRLLRSDDLARRMDPGYYRPGFAAASESARAAGWKRIGDTAYLQLAKDGWDRAGVSRGTMIRYIALGAVEDLSCRIVKAQQLRAWRTPSRARWVVAEHDVLVPYLLGSLSRVAIVDDGHVGAIASNGFYVLRADDDAHAAFVAAYLSTPGAHRQITRAGTGAVMKSISETLLMDILIPPASHSASVAKLLTRVREAASALHAVWAEGVGTASKLFEWTGDTDGSPALPEEDDEGDESEAEVAEAVA